MLHPAIQRLLNLIVDLYTVLESMIAAIVRPVWSVLKEVWAVVRPTRFSAFTILAGAILLFFTAQGNELAERFGDSGIPAIVILLFSVSWLAFQSWYWARVSIYFEYGTDRTNWPSKWIPVVPRLYAGAAFLVAAGALLGNNTGAAAFIAGAGIVFVLVLIYRTQIFATILAPTHKGPVKPQVFLELAPLTLLLLVGSALIALVAMALISIWPIGIGQMLGATSVAFFAFGNLIPIGSFLIIRSRELGYPMIVTLLIWAVFISPLADNHEVPTTGPLMTAKDDKRPSVKTAFEAWQKAQGRPSNEALPIVFVSTAGGGLRAAYWTATVLGQIQDTCPGFATRTFAISGVSGGSVGAAVFAARQTDRAVPDQTDCPIESVENVDQRFMQEVLSTDFLGPVVAAMLFPDLLQRFLPYPLLPDRGNALSDAWLTGWDVACAKLTACSGTHTGLSGTFLANGPPLDGTAWRPLLMLNGTHQETGKRIITSHVTVTRDVFFDAFDTHNILQKDLSLSTAALNSARFTYVTPAGRLVRASDGEDMGHVLDGGYFENYGAVTTTELIMEVANVAQELKQKIRPIVIQITSDPDLKPLDYPVPGTGFLELEAKPHFFANEIAGPVRGLMNTRGARGVLASKTVAELVRQINTNANATPYLDRAEFAHFELCPNPKELDEPKAPEDPKAPLGWALSKDTQKRIAEMLTVKKKLCDNPKELEKVIEALGPKAPDS